MYPVEDFAKIIPIDKYVLIIPVLTEDERLIYNEIDMNDTYTINLNKRGWNRAGADLIYVEELEDWFPAELFNITEIRRNGPRSTKR